MSHVGSRGEKCEQADEKVEGGRDKVERDGSYGRASRRCSVSLLAPVQVLLRCERVVLMSMTSSVSSLTPCPHFISRSSCRSSTTSKTQHRRLAYRQPRLGTRSLGRLSRGRRRPWSASSWKTKYALLSSTPFPPSYPLSSLPCPPLSSSERGVKTAHLLRIRWWGRGVGIADGVCAFVGATETASITL
jgi:hypothetical protein